MKELYITMKDKPFLLESSFTSYWLKHLNKLGYYTDKISDWSIWYKRVDCYIATDKNSYLCEIKVINKNIFPLRRLSSNQWSALKCWNKLRTWAIVVVYSKTLNKYAIIPFNKIKDLDRDSSIELTFTQ